MATISRGAKQGSSGTDLEDNQTILSAELNADFNTIVNEINGQLDEDNILAGAITNTSINATANIAETKIDDISATAAAQQTTADPGAGDTSNRNLATSLQAEIQQLRRAILRLGVGTSANNGAAEGEAGWYDFPPSGRNLIQNGLFTITDDRASGAPTDPSLPVGWNEIIGDETWALTTATGLGDAQAVRVSGSGSAGAGATQTLAGLKPGARYLIGCEALATTGTFALTTTGADTSSDFPNLNLTRAVSSLGRVVGIVQTQSPIADLVVNLTAQSAGHDVTFANVFAYECAQSRTKPQGRHTYRMSFTGASGQTIGTTWANVTDGTDALSVTVMPVQGCQIRAKAKMVFSTSTNQTAGLRVLEDGTARDASFVNTTTDVIETLAVEYTNASPAPGTALTYTVQMVSGASTVTLGNAGLDSQGSISFLEVEILFP